MYNFFSVVTCLLLTQILFAQSYECELDSLNLCLKNSITEKAKTVLLLKKADLMIKNKHNSIAYKLVTEINIKAKQEQNFNFIGKSFNLLGIIEKNQHNYNKALGNFYETIEIKDKIDDARIISDTYFQIGFIYMQIGSLTKAIDFLQKSNTEIPDNGHEIEKAKTINNIGYMYELSGKYDKALSYYRQALTVFELKKDKKSKAYVFNNIGALYREIENYTKALEYYQKSLILKQQLNDTVAMATTYNNIGVIYQKQKKYEEAIAIYNRALSISRRYNDLKRTGRTINNLGKIRELQGNYELAENLYTESLKLKDSIRDNHGKILSYLNLSRINMQRGEINTAISYLQRGITSADSLHFVKELSALYLEMSETYEKINDNKKALAFHKKYTAINDTLLSKEKQKNIDNLEIEYQTSKKEERLAFLKKENEKKEIILTRNSYLIIISGFLLLFISLFFYMQFRRKQLAAKNKRILLEQKLLRVQMNPHFIFNSLSSIQAYVYENNPLMAGKYIADFAKLMRLILENSRKEFISIQKEIETLNYYLKLQQIRFENKFDYNITLSENINLENDLIPPMLAQPIIENAIEHGVRKLEKKGSIEIVFTKHQNEMKLLVRDNGNGISNKQNNVFNKNASYAIKIIEERLACFNKKIKIKLTTTSDLQGNFNTEVFFEIPFKQLSYVQNNNN